MIPFNLKEESYKNHPMDGKYGVINMRGLYSGYPVTVVDNHDEVVDGKYTHNPALCLIHLSEHVRQYTSLRLFDEFLYISFAHEVPTYRMYDYDVEELSDEDITRRLKQVLYQVQPGLQIHSLVGSSSNRIEDDPNYYEGCYVLNDEKEYTILKCRTSYKFFRGKKRYYPNWKDTDDLIFEGEIDFNIYEVALTVQKLRKQIVTYTNHILDEESNSKFTKYRELKAGLDCLLETVYWNQ